MGARFNGTLSTKDQCLKQSVAEFDLVCLRFVTLEHDTLASAVFLCSRVWPEISMSYRRKHGPFDSERPKPVEGPVCTYGYALVVRLMYILVGVLIYAVVSAHWLVW